MQFQTETVIVACPIFLTAYTQQGVTCSGWLSLHLRLPPNSAFKCATVVDKNKIPVEDIQCDIYEDITK